MTSKGTVKPLVCTRAVQGGRAADHVRAAAEVGLPRGVAEDGRRRHVRLILAVVKIAAQCRRYAERSEKSRTDAYAAHWHPNWGEIIASMPKSS